MRSDEHLIQAVRDGDLEAFELLYQRHSRKVLGYIGRLVGDRALAEDLLQEVFMKVLRPDGFQPGGGRFVGWIFRVARNMSLNAIRSRGREDERIADAATTNPESQRAGQAEAAEARQRLLGALSHLTPEHQDTLVLNKVAGMTYREIAALHQVPEGTVKSRLHHAIAAVRPLLTDSTGGES